MTQSANRVSPVLQFVLLIVPIVFSSFYFVYGVVGLFIDGRDKAQWAAEAWDVSLMTAMMIVGFSGLVLLLVKIRSLGMRHILALSSMFHIALAMVLTGLVAILVNG